MKIWSIGLVVGATLAIASPNTASAGFAPRPNAILSLRTGGANHFSQAGILGPRDYSGSFHRRRNRQPQLDPSADQGSPTPYPAADGGPTSYGPDAPNVNAIPVAPVFGQIYAPSAGPKIIIISARQRSAHFAKMPVVVYGTQVDRSY